MSTCATWVTSINFTQQTLYYLIYQFNWHVMITMSQFCFIFSIIIAFSIFLPAIITIPSNFHNKSNNNNNNNKKNDTLLGLDLPSSSSSSSSGIDSNSSNSSSGGGKVLSTSRYIGNIFFEIIFLSSVLTFVALEFLVREQVDDICMIMKEILLIN